MILFLYRFSLVDIVDIVDIVEFVDFLKTSPELTFIFLYSKYIILRIIAERDFIVLREILIIIIIII